MPFPSPGRIFISYRRKETGAHAGRLRDHLAARFGDEQLFMDVENLEPGVDFHKVIRAVVATCAVQVVVIGPGWAAATDERGHRRLDDPDDLVRIEVEAALAREVRVIPVLIEQAAMPRPGELPESLAGLVRRQALRVRHETFRADADRLVLAVEKVLSASAAASTVVSLAVTIRARRAHVLPHRGWVNEVAFSPGGRWLATASDDGTARIWNAATGEERRQLPHDDKVSGLAFGPDRLGLATAGDDHAARIWNAATGKQRLLLPHDGAVWGVAFSPDGRWLATAAGDQRARVWALVDLPPA